MGIGEAFEFEKTGLIKPELKSIRRSELPDMQPVASSNIYAIGYDAVNKMLYVLFSKDAPVVYRYPQIDAERHKFVMSAESVGKAFAKSIKGYSTLDPAFAHEKLVLVGDGIAVEESSP